MARTQPDPVVSPPRSSPAEGGPRGGGGGGGGGPGRPGSDRGRGPRRDGATDDSRGPPRDRAPRLAGGIQYTSCSNCKAAYVLSADALTAGGSVGAKVRCAVCKHVWFQKADRLTSLAPGLGMKDYPEERKEVIASGGDFRQERAPMGDRPPRGGPGGDRRGGGGDRAGGYASRGAGAGGGDRRSEGGDRRGRSSASKTTVFVGNLPFSASEDDLRTLLTSSGAGVNKLTIVADQDGRPKGFAFAEMASEADMRAVVDGLDGVNLGGRNVSIREGK